MQFNDVIPDFPEIKDSEMNVYDLSFALNELEQAQNIFMLYENKEGEIRLFFDKLSAPLFACRWLNSPSLNRKKCMSF